jgi:predicted DNA-binding transcriptional regulator AlpA
MTSEAHRQPSKLLINPQNHKLNAAGFVMSEYVTRLPDGMIADDLKEPDIWRSIQKGRFPLKKLDRVLLVAWDESWVAEALVEQASADGVWLAKPRITQLSGRSENLFGDGTYQVTWNGGGYHVVRLRDGAKMTDTLANAPLAERALAGLYPRRA